MGKKRFGFAELGIIVIWVAINVSALTTSQGAPTCEGLLIYSSTDSLPPTCNSIIDGLWRFSALTFVAVALGYFIVSGTIRFLRGKPT